MDENDALVMFFQAIIALTVIGVGAYFFDQKQKAKRELQRERLRILEQAIASGRLDPGQRDDLLAAVAGKARAGGLAESKTRMFTFGWLGLFVGVGLWFADDNDTRLVGMLCTALSVGLLTLPIALREMRRSGAA